MLVPERVWIAGEIVATDPALSAWLGGPTAHMLLAGDRLAATALAKAALLCATGADAVDLESAAALRAARRHGLPFAALRAVCDPAERDLPPAALAALDARGAIGLAAVLGSVLRQPGQIGDLIAVGRDAGRARTALAAQVRRIASRERAR